MSRLARVLDDLAASGALTSASVRSALERVDVGHYTDHDLTPFLHDRPVPFLETDTGGMKTISAPHMLVMMLQHLEAAPGHDVLVVGAKAGYLTALVAELVGPGGSVMLVDPDERVMEHARQRLGRGEHPAEVRTRKLASLERAPPGLPDPLHRVLVTGALPSLPAWLERRLADGGFAIAPLGGVMSQQLVKRERQGGAWLDTDLGSVVFGPVDVRESEPARTGLAHLIEGLDSAADAARRTGVLAACELVRLDGLLDTLRDLLHPPPGQQVDVDTVQQLLDTHAEWITSIWPTLETALDEEPDEPSEAGGGSLGTHEDLVP